MKRIAILGSTGSIGSNALKVIQANSEKCQVIHLSAYSNAEKLIQQAKHFSPASVCIVNKTYYPLVKQSLSPLGIKVTAGKEGILEACQSSENDLVLNAIVGAAGLEPTVAALQSGKSIALSNKESIVMAGALLNDLKSEFGGKIYPVDSEHSAIWQCLQGEKTKTIEALILTGSGGPFRKRKLSTFSGITPQEALKHPNWSMGNKITIDSATMMNKGLEIIEARWLFGIPSEKIEVVIHPQSIIHSMVRFKDGSVKAQLGLPDMKIPIQYALSYPERWETSWENFNFQNLPEITFENVDHKRFPCINLAYKALRMGKNAPAVLNEANELAVNAFLKGQIRFTVIPTIIENALSEIDSSMPLSLESVYEIRKQVMDWFRKKMGSFES